MHQITQFQFEQHEVRIVEINGEPWWIAMDVADSLGYSDAYKMTSRLDEDEKQNLQIGGFGNRGVTIINESGLYSAVLGSEKPEAKRFKKWVTAEVLPTIRKTGQYQTKQAITIDQASIALAFTDRILSALPNLGESAKQCLLSKASEIAFGQALIPLPTVTEHLMSATEVGDKLGISANMVGRLANAHGLKINEFGEFRLDKSRHSSKQVESFYYNDSAIKRLKQIING